MSSSKKRSITDDNTAIKKSKIGADLSSSKTDFFHGHFCQDITDEIVDKLTSSKPSLERIKLKLERFSIIHHASTSNTHCTNPSIELSLSDFGINSKLIKNFDALNKGDLSGQQRVLYQVIGRYMDLLFVSKGFNYLGTLRDDDIERARDQGFSRPKVLILTPFKKFAYEIVQGLIKMVFGDEQRTFVMNSAKFEEEYGDDGNRVHAKRDVAQEYKDLMSGNIDDCFRIGIAMAKKSLKLYAKFEESDFLLCSPLGLRMIIGDNVESHHERDFLSSIEVMIVDRAHIMLMQNWDHLTHIFENINEKPSQINVDISRVRNWSLKEYSKFYRQTIVFSELNFSELHALFSLYGKNYAGLVTACASPISILNKIGIPLLQELHRFDIDDPKNQSDFRYNYFVKNILSKCDNGTLIFIPSYFDYVRLRNYLKREEESFVQLHEYAKDEKIARARDLFFHGKKRLMLLTERFYYFRRYRLKGIKTLVFYQLPTNPQFYTELINYTMPEDRLLSKLIFCKFDSFRLQNVFGAEQARQLIKSDKKFHALLSE